MGLLERGKMSQPFIEDDMMRAKRGMSWIRLEESLRGTGCPVCTEIERTEKHYFEGMLYEYVLDAGVRKKLHQQHGFCTRHAKLALEAELALKSDGLHLATMFETVMEDHLKQIKNQAGRVKESKEEAAKRKKRRAFSASEVDECFVCKFLKESENIALHGLVYFSGEDEFIEAYRKSRTIICYRHVQMIIKDAADPAWAGKISERVLNVTLDKLDRLKLDLSNFIKKHDYRSVHDYTRDELDSYIDVVNFFAGQMRL